MYSKVNAARTIEKSLDTFIGRTRDERGKKTPKILIFVYIVNSSKTDALPKLNYAYVLLLCK